MKKIVIVLFILTIVLFAAAIGGLKYTTEKFVEKQVIQAKPFADISYKEVKPSLDGSVTINGVKVFIPSIDETIYIKSAQFLAPDLMTLLTLDSKLQNKQLPDSLSLSLTSVVLDMNGNLMKTMDNPDIEPTKLEAFSTLACGDTYRIGSKALSKMGYEELTGDIVLRYQFDANRNILNFTINNHIHDMTHIDLSGAIQNVTDLNSFVKKTSRPGKFTLEIRDDSYIERKNRFCANQGKRKVDEYIDEHTKQTKEYLLSYGVIPEDGLLNAYKTIIQTPGTILLEADLSNLTGIEEFKTFEPNDIIQFMRLQLFVNEERINEISVDIDKEKLVETATSEDAEIATPDQIQKKRAIIYKKYRPVSAENLRNFNGYRVKIETTRGKNYKGNINTSNPGRYEIITRLRSGNISYFVKPGQIRTAKVFH